MPLSELPELDRPPARSRWLPSGAASTTSRLIGAASCQETSPDSAAGIPLRTFACTLDAPGAAVPLDGLEPPESAKATTLARRKVNATKVRRRRRNCACRRARSAAVRAGARRRPVGVDAMARRWTGGRGRGAELLVPDPACLAPLGVEGRAGRGRGGCRDEPPSESRSLIVCQCKQQLVCR